MHQPHKPRTWFLYCLLLGSAAGLRAETDLERAARLMKGRNYPEAQALLEEALRATPPQAEALALMGELQLATRHPDKAADYAAKAIQIDPGKARYYLLRGNALGVRAQQVSMFRAMGLVGDIRGSFEKAVQLEPKNRKARFALFSFYLNAPGIVGGGMDKAKGFAEQTQVLDAAIGHEMKGLILQKQKNPGAAQIELRMAQAADPKLASVYNALGYVELEMKQLDIAVEDFQKQVELEPDDANSYDSLGDGWVAKGRLDQAIEAYQKALAINPMFTASMRSLGKALEQAGRREEAIQHYRRCAQLGAQYGIAPVVTESKARLKALGAEG